MRWSPRIAAVAIALVLAASIPLVRAQPHAPSMSAQMRAAVTAASSTGCDKTLWNHVYNPGRLEVFSPCITVTGVIEDATANQKIHHTDGVRHEGDGDTHGWLKPDPQFMALLDPGNNSNEDANLVFEIVCHYRVSQQDAKAACYGFKDHSQIPPVGSHVAITGSFVRDEHHAHWMEIHPVSKVEYCQTGDTCTAQSHAARVSPDSIH